MDNSSSIEAIVAGAANAFALRTATSPEPIQPAETTAEGGAESQAAKETSQAGGTQESSKDDTQNEKVESTDAEGSSVNNGDRLVENVNSEQPAPTDQTIGTVGAATIAIVEGGAVGGNLTEPIAGPSGTQSATLSEDFRNILGDIDIPEGVDPSFLAALPEDMRQEVISEHLRLQSLRSRPPAATTGAPAEPASVVDVSPEFLAALPPNIQEEVLAQQRIEQQRRMATVSNPNDPMDTEAFFRNLQPSLRQAVSFQMI